jgi:hypothetical protein
VRARGRRRPGVEADLLAVGALEHERRLRHAEVVAGLEAQLDAVALARLALAAGQRGELDLGWIVGLELEREGGGVRRRRRRPDASCPAADDEAAAPRALGSGREVDALGGGVRERVARIVGEDRVQLVDRAARRQR